MAKLKISAKFADFEPIWNITAFYIKLADIFDDHYAKKKQNDNLINTQKTHNERNVFICITELFPYLLSKFTGLIYFFEIFNWNAEVSKNEFLIILKSVFAI